MADTNEVVLIAEATARPGKRDDLRHAFDILVPQTRAEDGVNAFILHENIAASPEQVQRQALFSAAAHHGG